MRVWSPGARVGHAWLNVEAMNGMVWRGAPSEGAGGRGIARGRLGFDVAVVGKGGKDSMSGVRPGIQRATALWIS